jgi:hypothetical protein
MPPTPPRDKAPGQRTTPGRRAGREAVAHGARGGKGGGSRVRAAHSTSTHLSSAPDARLQHGNRLQLSRTPQPIVEGVDAREVRRELRVQPRLLCLDDAVSLEQARDLCAKTHVTIDVRGLGGSRLQTPRVEHASARARVDGSPPMMQRAPRDARAAGSILCCLWRRPSVQPPSAPDVQM